VLAGEGIVAARVVVLAPDIGVRTAAGMSLFYHPPRRAPPCRRPGAEHDRWVARVAWNERVRSSPYYPALVHPVFRRILPGAAASALGDGMSAVAIAWLALKLAPADSRGLWVGAAWPAAWR
jgi:hypothetical protein